MGSCVSVEQVVVQESKKPQKKSNSKGSGSKGPGNHSKGNKSGSNGGTAASASKGKSRKNHEDESPSGERPKRQQNSANGEKKGDARGRPAQGGAVAAAAAAGGGGGGMGGSGDRAAIADAPSIPSARLNLGENQRAKRLKYKELQMCTNNFDESLLLGEGSFGKVYRGVLDEALLNANGSGGGPSVSRGSSGSMRRVDVAIKKLNPESFQGYEEWLAEVLLLDKLRHPNLVRLIGYCAERGEALLAYELCPHGSLDNVLFNGFEDGSVLSWEQRVDVALDSARGLAYLHENNVIHRDFKPSNILLAEDFSGRLTDFGMARAGPDGGETHISTRVMGTMGYLDPTYMETGRLTRKSDTYAFGVMLLELLTGRRSMGENGAEALVAWVRPLLAQKKPDLNQLVDPLLEGRYSRAGAVKMAILAKHCIHEDPGYRPEMTTLAENLHLVDKKDP